MITKPSEADWHRVAAAVDTIEVDGIPVACLEPDGTVAWLSNATDDIKRSMEIG